MKQYAILNKDGNNPVIVSTNSHDFAELLQIGYSVIYTGNRKECEVILSEEESFLIY